MYDMTEFLESLVSPQTRRSYKFALATFEAWYKKPLKDLLSEPEPTRLLEKYWVYLKETYKSNTPRSKFNPVLQYMKFNGIEPKIRKSLHVHKQIVSVNDHVLSMLELRKMYGVSSLEEKIMLKVWTLGLRVRDATLLEWKDFDFGEPTDGLKEIRIVTKKEETPAYLYMDKEFQTLLKQYLPTIDQENKCLLQSNKGGRYSEKQLVRKIQALRNRAGIKTTKVFGWHIGRDLVLTTGTNLGLNSWGLKIMVGKSTGANIWDYISHVNLISQAEILRTALRMELEQVGSNGAHAKMEEEIEFISKVVAKVVRELRGDQYRTPSTGIGLVVRKSDKEVLEEYLEET
jgi:site-specific recombinase XerD